MNVFKIISWINKQKDKIRGFTLMVLIVPSVQVIVEVAKGSFEMFGYTFWILILAFVGWLINEIQLSD